MENLLGIQSYTFGPVYEGVQTEEILQNGNANLLLN